MANRIRIIAGNFRGRLLEVPQEGTRPLADRVRQALFAILEPRIPGSRVLDICAGSGAAGLEALSRGAESVQFIEISRRATDTIRRNVSALGVEDLVQIYTAGALAGLDSVVARHDEVDLIIADPPYDDVTLRNQLLAKIATNPSPLKGGGTLVLSRRRSRGGTAQEPPSGLRLVRTLTFGETEICIYDKCVAEVLG